MTQIKSICVYCGSGSGLNPIYKETAHAFGEIIAKHGIGLVFGGGKHGLMGTIAQSVLDAGGRVTGIIPDFLLEREGEFHNLSELVVTKSMHERKQQMFEKSDAFVALPGGIGTLEEIVEMMTWAQLGRHKKSIVLANVDGFWEPLVTLLEHMRQEEFIRRGLEVTFRIADSIEDVLPKLNEQAG
jgi:hypothetical protein